MLTDSNERPGPTPEGLGRLQQLLDRTRQGDASALPALGMALEAHPELWQQYGDLAAQAEAAWIELISGPDLFLRDSLYRKMGQLRTELSGPSPTPLERLLVSRVVACWLQVHYSDTIAAQLRDAGPARHTTAIRRQSWAQQRYLQAIRSLATVRKLLKPPPALTRVRPATACPSP
jgi:hypothetical protein